MYIWCDKIPKVSYLTMRQRCSSKRGWATFGKLMSLGLHRRSATAAALGQSREMTLVLSTYSPHIVSSPPITSFFWASVPETENQRQGSTSFAQNNSELFPDLFQTSVKKLPRLVAGMFDDNHLPGSKAGREITIHYI